MTEIKPENISSKIDAIVSKLNKADGNENDGVIKASIWNEFVQGKGGKTIKYSITLENARKSISTYLNRNANSSGQTVNDLAKTWLERDIETGNASKESLSVKPSTAANVNKKPQTSYKGALDKFKTAEHEAGAILAILKHAINTDNLSSVAVGDSDYFNNIYRFGADAFSILLSNQTDDVVLLLNEMPNSKKLNLMREFVPEFSGTKVNDEDLVTVAKKHLQNIENNARVEEAQINATKEAQRKSNIKNLGQSFEVKPDAVTNVSKRDLEKIKNKAAQLEKNVENAFKADALNSFAAGNNWAVGSLDKYDKNAKALFIAGNSENAQLLLADMSNSKKIKLMKEFVPEYNGTKVEDEELIAAAQKHTKELQERVKAEDSKIKSITSSYNKKVKTLAEMRYANERNLKKTVKNDNDGRSTVTVTYGDNVVIVKFAPNDKKVVEQVTIGDIVINIKGNDCSVMQGQESISIGSKNLSQTIMQIVERAKV